jgi:hypothetical protein
MSRSALLALLEPPGTDVPLDELPLLPLLSLPLVVPLPELPELPELLEPPELLECDDPEPWPPPQLAPWEPRAPVSATTAIPKTAIARTWRSFTFNPVDEER